MMSVDSCTLPGVGTPYEAPEASSRALLGAAKAMVDCWQPRGGRRSAETFIEPHRKQFLQKI